MRQLLAVDEFPDRAVVDLQAKFSQFGDQAAQSEVSVATAVQQPSAPVPDQLLRPVAAHFARLDAASLASPSHPADHRAHPNPVMCRRLPSRHLATLNRAHRPFTKIHRVGSRHSCWPPSPASKLNRLSSDSGIPLRLRLNSSRSSAKPRSALATSAGAKLNTPGSTHSVSSSTVSGRNAS